MSLFRSGTDKLNQVSDEQTALAAAKQLQANAERVRKIADELKAIGRLTTEDERRTRPPNKADVDAHAAAAKKVVGLIATNSLPAEANQAIQAAMVQWGAANVSFGQTLRSIAPKKG
jgi:hypothetical protein